MLANECIPDIEETAKKCTAECIPILGDEGVVVKLPGIKTDPGPCTSYTYAGREKPANLCLIIQKNVSFFFYFPTLSRNVFLEMVNAVSLFLCLILSLKSLWFLDYRDVFRNIAVTQMHFFPKLVGSEGPNGMKCCALKMSLCLYFWMILK